MKKLWAALFTASLLFYMACSDSNSGNAKDDTIKYLTYGIVYYSAIWQKVTVADVPGFSFTNTDGQSLTPSCSCPPSYEATNNKTTTYNPEFAFFVRRGSSNNLLIFFMGGGACWDITNCAYNHTYSGQLIESNLLLGMGATGSLGGQGVGGIVDTSNANNPFKDWTMVWIPYCTADLGMGQKDYTYPEDYGTAYPGGVTIRHRGLVNVKMVLQWLQTNITTPPDKLFVTSSSAGSYSAMLAFPLIRDVFSSTSTKAYVLGDAGEGVAGEYDPDGAGGTAAVPFMQVVENIWGLQLDRMGTKFSGKTVATYNYNYNEIVKAIVDFYPNDRFAQYTTMWDKTQVWFYYIQKDNNIHSPDQWGAEENADPGESISTEWKNLMLTNIDIAGDNYWYYIGPGKDHTIDLRPRFYTETSQGVYFFDWVTSFVNDELTINDNKVCTDCPFVP